MHAHTVCINKYHWSNGLQNTLNGWGKYCTFNLYQWFMFLFHLLGPLSHSLKPWDWLSYTLDDTGGWWHLNWGEQACWNDRSGMVSNTVFHLLRSGHYEPFSPRQPPLWLITMDVKLHLWGLKQGHAGSPAGLVWYISSTIDRAVWPGQQRAHSKSTSGHGWSCWGRHQSRLRKRQERGGGWII